MKTLNKLAVAVVSAAGATSAFAVGPSAGDLTNLVPDGATILALIAAVAVVSIGIALALRGSHIAKSEGKKIG